MGAEGSTAMVRKLIILKFYKLKEANATSSIPMSLHTTSAQTQTTDVMKE